MEAVAHKLLRFGGTFNIRRLSTKGSRLRFEDFTGLSGPGQKSITLPTFAKFRYATTVADAEAIIETARVSGEDVYISCALNEQFPCVDGIIVLANGDGDHRILLLQMTIQRSHKITGLKAVDAFKSLRDAGKFCGALVSVRVSDELLYTFSGRRIVKGKQGHITMVWVLSAGRFGQYSIQKIEDDSAPSSDVIAQYALNVGQYVQCHSLFRRFLMSDIYLHRIC